jgi:AAT family amino acid transporter
VRPDQDNELARGLSHRQLQMMAIGGTIGVGLFLGSGKAIRNAGPAVIISYLVAGAVVFLMLRALGEMAVDRPTSGSFANYAEELVGRWAGFATGWTYWMMWVTTVMAEITAIGIYTEYFFPGVPQWAPALVAVGLLLAANLASVRLFGEAEFWFALIKIVAIVAFIVAGIVILAFKVGELAETAAVSNLWKYGGFFPNGPLGPLLALQMVTFAFMGVEMIGVAAGEAKDPKRELPKAINRVAWRILLFYVVAILIVLMLIPWTEVGVKESPFVLAWASLGIAGAGGILNGVVLTSALSSSNSGIFASARMLRALSVAGVAPRQLRPVSKRHVPARALAVSALALVAGVAINVVSPDKAFTYITSVATVGVLWVWGMIAVTHLRFRRLVNRGERPASAFRLPGSPWTNYIVLAYVVLVAVLFGVAPNQRVALIAGAVWALVLVVGWWHVSRKEAAARVVENGIDSRAQ